MTDNKKPVIKMAQKQDSKEFIEMKKKQEELRKQQDEIKKQNQDLIAQIKNLQNKKNNRPVYDRDTYLQIREVAQKQKEMKQRQRQINEEIRELETTAKNENTSKYQSTEDINQEIQKLEYQLENDDNADEKILTKQIQELHELKMNLIKSKKHKQGNETKLQELNQEYEKNRKTIRANTVVLDQLFEKQEKLDKLFEEQMKQINIEEIDDKIQELSGLIKKNDERYKELRLQIDNAHKLYLEQMNKSKEQRKALDRFYDNKFRIVRENGQIQVVKPRLNIDRDKKRREEFIQVLKDMENEVQPQEEKKETKDVVEQHGKKKVIVIDVPQDEIEEPIFEEFEISKSSMRNKEARDKKIQELEQMDKTKEYQEQYEQRCALLNKLVNEYRELGGKIEIIDQFVKK